MVPLPSREKKPMVGKTFGALPGILSSQPQSAIQVLQLLKQLPADDVADWSYELFKRIVGSEDLTEQHWEVARLAIRNTLLKKADERKEIFKFLDHHLCLQGEGEDHGSSIASALDAILVTQSSGLELDPQGIESVRNFTWSGPSFVKGLRSIMRPANTFGLRFNAMGLIAAISDKLFNSSALTMEGREMSEFCEHLAVFMIDEARHIEFVQSCGIAIILGQLRSPEWREHIAARFWSYLAYAIRDWTEGSEALTGCLENAIELLGFVRGLPHGEGFKWWYGLLWLHHEKLNAEVGDEVERVAKAMSGDRALVLRLYLSLIQHEITRIQKEMENPSDKFRMPRRVVEMRPRLVALEATQRKLVRIVNGGE